MTSSFSNFRTTDSPGPELVGPFDGVPSFGCQTTSVEETFQDLNQSITVHTFTQFSRRELFWLRAAPANSRSNRNILCGAPPRIYTVVL